MLHVFGGLKSLFSLSVNGPKPETESSISKLHYRVTAIVFLVCCVLVTSVEYVGNGTTIACLQDGHPDYWPIPAHVMNTYCFIMGTFTLPKHFAGEIGKDVIHPGVGEYNKERDEMQYKAYYQWVPFVLFLQACLFYVPHALFKVAEGGKVGGIISGLHQTEAEVHDDERGGRHKILAKYFMKCVNTHNLWALKMLICELLTLVNVIGNIYFIDTFLGGEFSSYGLQVASFVEDDPQNRIDPMSRVFPRMTKCLYQKYGPSGSIQTHDALCMLPINVINEKIYVFIWFWLIFLAVVTTLSVLYHLILILSPSTLSHMIKRRLRHKDGISDILDDITNNFQFGDWKLLHILAYNMTPVIFGEFVLELDTQLGEKEEAELKPNDSNANLRKPLLTPI